jgi:hypothetical protein
VIGLIFSPACEGHQRQSNDLQQAPMNSIDFCATRGWSGSSETDEGMTLFLSEEAGTAA